MPLILGRQAVLQEYARAAEKHWVLPAFNAESQTCLEAILSAARERAEHMSQRDLPIIVGLTNLYQPRAQTVAYSRLADWKIGLRMFLDDVAALCSKDSPFRHLHVMVHMDHLQWDADAELLRADPARFSSLMFDASKLALDENMRRTAAFVAEHGNALLIEGACDEIPEASANSAQALTTPEMARQYFRATGVDIIVPNLGTEHRASARDLRYHGDLARAIRDAVGPRICLHGTSSVPPDRLRTLFDDGIRKANIWTALERDSAPALMEHMLKHADQVVGKTAAGNLAAKGLLGAAAPCHGPPLLPYFTASYRNSVVFTAIKRIVREFLELWYT